MTSVPSVPWPRADSPFDPIDRAGDLWEQHFGDSTSMRFVTSVMRVQQLLLAELDATLKPYGITFARYEVLVLHHLQPRGPAPAVSKIGRAPHGAPDVGDQRHRPARRGGLVERTADETDRRRTFAELTAEGKDVVAGATKALMAIEFGVPGLEPADQHATTELLRSLRVAAGDFHD